MTPNDLATVLERVALRLRTEGQRAESTTRSWADTIRAASYGEDKGGNHWEIDQNGEVQIVPNDPTGEQAIDPDEIAQLHSKLMKQKQALTIAAATLEHIFDQASPDPAKHPRLPDAPVDDDRWCHSCKQDAGRLTPVAVHPDGRVRYRGSCRWCHDFEADYGRRPTPSLIRKHHTPYVNVTETEILRALGIKGKATA